MIAFMYMDCGRTVSTLDLVNIMLVMGETGDEGREGGLWEIVLREPQPESRDGNNIHSYCVVRFKLSIFNNKKICMAYKELGKCGPFNEKINRNCP